MTSLSITALIIITIMCLWIATKIIKFAIIPTVIITLLLGAGWFMYVNDYLEI